MIKKIILLVSMLCIIASSAFAMKNENTLLNSIDWDTTPTQIEENYSITKIFHEENFEHIFTDKIQAKTHEIVFIDNAKFNINNKQFSPYQTRIFLFKGKIWKIDYIFPYDKTNIKIINKQLKKQLGKPASTNYTADTKRWNKNLYQITFLENAKDGLDYKPFETNTIISLTKKINLSKEDKEKFDNEQVCFSDLLQSRKEMQEFKEKHPQLYKEIVEISKFNLYHY